MYASNKVFFLVILFFSASLIYISLTIINSSENALSGDSSDLVKFERKPLEEQAIKLSVLTEFPQIESNVVTKTEEAGKRKPDSIVDETNHQIAVQAVGNAGDSFGAEIQLRNYLSDYAYQKNSFYLDALSCTSNICDVSIRFFTYSDHMLNQISRLLRDMPWSQTYVDNISKKDLSAKLIIQTDELK